MTLDKAQRNFMTPAEAIAEVQLFIDRRSITWRAQAVA